MGNGICNEKPWHEPSSGIACWRSHPPGCRTLTHHAAASECGLIQRDDSALRQEPITAPFHVLICAIISPRMTGILADRPEATPGSTVCANAPGVQSRLNFKP